MLAGRLRPSSTSRGHAGDLRTAEKRPHGDAQPLHLPVGPVLHGPEQKPEALAVGRVHVLGEVGNFGRELAGFETDVCITHSAVGLGEAGYRVVIAEDAVYSPSGAHLSGIARLRDLGFELMRCKSVYYDWIRTLPAARAFQEHNPELANPPGFSL